MELSINDLRQLIGAPAPAAPASRDFGPAILVADRGFVWVGHVATGGGYHTISYAQNIRVWGTTRGLGELVSGPTPETKLDPVGTIHCPDRAVIAVIPVDCAAWSSILR